MLYSILQGFTQPSLASPGLQSLAHNTVYVVPDGPLAQSDSLHSGDDGKGWTVVHTNKKSTSTKQASGAAAPGKGYKGGRLEKQQYHRLRQ